MSIKQNSSLEENLVLSRPLNEEDKNLINVIDARLYNDELEYVNKTYTASEIEISFKTRS